MPVDAHVMGDVLELVNQLAGDWEYDGEITPDTYFLADLGLESLDLVVMGTMIQQRYGKLPFAELLANIGQRPVHERDITVRELVAYICEHRSATVVERRRGDG